MQAIAAEFWTDARRADLADMLGRGLGYGECGRLLGCPRNVAAAEAARLIDAGVVVAPQPAAVVVAMPLPPAKVKRGRPPREPKAPRDPKVEKTAKPAKSDRPAVPVLSPREITSRVGMVAGSQPKPWMQRAKHGECAWPVRGVGADVWSCCGPCQHPRRYCEPHFEVMYQKPPRVKYVPGRPGGQVVR